MPDLGFNNEGTTVLAVDSSMNYASHDTSDGSGGTTSAIYIKVKNTRADVSRSIIVGIYSDDSGQNRPQALLATQLTITIPPSHDGWVSIAYVASLSPSTKYWLGYHAGSSEVQVYRSDADANRGITHSTTGGVLSDPWEDSGNSNTIYRRCIYATYGSSTPNLSVLVYETQVVDEWSS